LAVEAIEMKDVDCVETTIDDIGPVMLRAEPGGSIGVKSDRLRPELVLKEPISLSFEIAGRDKVTLWLEKSGSHSRSPGGGPATASSGQVPPCGPANDERGWDGSLPTGRELPLRLRGVRAVRPNGSEVANLGGAEDYRVSREAARFRFVGGRTDSRLNLALPHPAGQTALLRVLNPETGEVSPPKTLPIALVEPRSFSWQNRLVLLDPEAVAERKVPLLRPDLKVRELEFSRRVQHEAKSFVIEGEARFPAGELEPIKFEQGWFVSVESDPDRPMTLRSLELADHRLELLLWGEPNSLRAGPTPELRVQRLPSYFEWLATNHLSGFIYGTLAYVSAISLGVLKFLGWSIHG
jgi:hypothetical protein